MSVSLGLRLSDLMFPRFLASAPALFYRTLQCFARKDSISSVARMIRICAGHIELQSFRVLPLMHEPGVRGNRGAVASDPRCIALASPSS
jgi:hypothetical protein